MTRVKCVSKGARHGWSSLGSAVQGGAALVAVQAGRGGAGGAPCARAIGGAGRGTRFGCTRLARGVFRYIWLRVM
jgi:hypothetical protein